MDTVGIVVIGRNEGDRLRRCLLSVRGTAAAVVYVDSGSSDGSPELAAALGADVVRLDLSRPFTAARARNTGFRRLRQVRPGVEFVQFVDGDCEVAPGWPAAAAAALAGPDGTAVVCGRRRERFPEATVWNRLCDLEWDTPVGEADACGGDAMMRVTAFEAVGGFREGLIAGEEPELCHRLRAAGWKVRRLAADMTLHDAAMTRAAQWWTRAIRAGHAFAECHWLHRDGPVPMWRREVRGVVFWGLLMPLAAAALTAAMPWGLLYPAAVLLSAALVFRRRLRRDPVRSAALFAAGCAAAKVPQAVGLLSFHIRRVLGRPRGLIEYK